MEGVRHVMLVERYLGVVTPERVAGLVADTRVGRADGRRQRGGDRVPQLDRDPV